MDFTPVRGSSPLAQHGLEILATAVLLLDRARTIVYANPAAENLFELSARHLVGHTPAQVFAESAGLDAAIDKAVAAGATYTEQELELGGRRQAAAASHVHGVAGRRSMRRCCSSSATSTSS